MVDVRVRFPPSPTGYLHIGGARTALYNWLYARKNDGKLILRIEDTDTERSTKESIEGIISGLEWLGIDWDEGPYYQTDFADDHIRSANKLLKNGKAYKCFCTKDELKEKREMALKAKKDVKYDGTCRKLTKAEVDEKEKEGLPYIIRFKVDQNDNAVAYNDKVFGHIEQALKDIEDFVIVRSDGKPLYLLCNVVDDIRDRITHIIRGQDHMTNTIRQILLYRAFNATPPVFAHLPLLLDAQKRKISKRSHGELVAVQFYKEHGFIPWALCNFLVLLGWSSGTDEEFFTREELVQEFSLDRIGKTNSSFNYRKGDNKYFTDPKALAINAHYLRNMKIEVLGELVKSEFKNAGLWDNAYDNKRKKWFLKTLDMIRERFHTIKDFETRGRAYFSDQYIIEEKPLRKNILKYPDLCKWLPQVASRLSQLTNFKNDEIEQTLREMAIEFGIKPGILINGMRTVLTGQLAGPSMFGVIETLGRNTVVKRLENVDYLYKDGLV